jgi:hydroxymethylpyrimidine/phosphomethylpyrimidine kinase
MKSALTIAASDPSGGAGIQADLRAFSYAGVHGCSVITCVTAQNTNEVYQINAVPMSAVEAQLDAVLEDIKISACKTGMLYSPRIIELVAKKCGDFNFPLVVDPVMKATVGGDLHESGFLEALTKEIIPKCTLVTPNIPEAEAITGQEIKDIADMKSVCKMIHDLGCDYVLLKGGHLREDMATDILFDGMEYHLYLSSYHPKNLHGTGCTHSALICGFLARGKTMKEAASEAKIHIANLIESSYSIGGGVGVLGMVPSPNFSPLEFEIIDELKPVLLELVDVLPISFMPEVGINIGFATPNAKTQDEVCALEGRLVRVGERIGYLGGFKFGASKHIARIILTAMKFDTQCRSAMNVKYSPEILKVCSSLNFTRGTYDREEEPEQTTTMEWGTEQAIKKLGKVPDIIYDTGGVGKEPMIRIVGKNPKDVLEKLKKIITEFKSEK